MLCRCCPLLFWKQSPFHTLITSGSPITPFSTNLFKYYLLFLMYLGGGEGRGTVWQRWETRAGKHACLELSSPCHWKERAGKLATNTRTQTHARHTPHRSRGVCEQPHSSYLGCLGSLCSAPPSAPSPLFFPPPGSVPVRCRGDGAGRGRAGSWLQPRLLGSGSCQDCCCCRRCCCSW